MSSDAAVVDRHVALVTARAALGLDEDLPPLRVVLEALGVRVATPCWDDPSVDWSAFDLAVLRSTWDYAERVAEFLRWAEACATVTHLLNPPAVVRWNTDKHYLLELDRAGVPVVPTHFVEPGADTAATLDRFLASGDDGLSVGTTAEFREFVVKPTIGAGSRDAARYSRREVSRARDHLARLLDEARSVMLQPYLERVDAQGETAVIYLEGAYSHAVCKGPLLHSGAGLVTGLFAPEVITPRTPSTAELDVASAAHATLRFGRLAYARIDLIHDARGAPVVLELELTEPSLFFTHVPGSAERFAAALLRRIARLKV